MTLTSPNCPSAQELPIMVENAVSSVAGRQGDQGRRGVGSALGPEPDVGRGATRVEYVVTLNRDVSSRLVRTVDED